MASESVYQLQFLASVRALVSWLAAAEKALAAGERLPTLAGDAVDFDYFSQLQSSYQKIWLKPRAPELRRLLFYRVSRPLSLASVRPTHTWLAAASSRANAAREESMVLSARDGSTTELAPSTCDLFANWSIGLRFEDEALERRYFEQRFCRLVAGLIADLASLARLERHKSADMLVTQLTSQRPGQRASDLAALEPSLRVEALIRLGLHFTGFTTAAADLWQDLRETTDLWLGVGNAAPTFRVQVSLVTQPDKAKRKRAEPGKLRRICIDPWHLAFYLCEGKNDEASQARIVAFMREVGSIAGGPQAVATQIANHLRALASRGPCVEKAPQMWMGAGMLSMIEACVCAQLQEDSVSLEPT